MSRSCASAVQHASLILRGIDRIEKQHLTRGIGLYIGLSVVGYFYRLNRSVLVIIQMKH